MVRLNATFNVNEDLTRESLLDALQHHLEADAAYVADFSKFSFENSKDFEWSDSMGSIHVGNYDKAMTMSFTQLFSNGRKTILTCVFRDQDPTHTVNIRMEEQFTGIIPLSEDDEKAVQIPMLLKEIFWNECGAPDAGILETKDGPIVLHKSDTQGIVQLLRAKGEGLTTPVLYISVRSDGSYAVSKDTLAETLLGQVHVVAEGNPMVSAEFKRLWKSGNAYPHDGTVGLLMPGYDILVFDYDTDEKTLIKLVQTSLCNQPVSVMYDANKLRQTYLASKMGGDPELTEMLDSMLQEKESENESLQAQVKSLQKELLSARTQLDQLKTREESQPDGRAITLSVEENDLYPGEIKDVILKTLAQAYHQMSGDTKRAYSRKSDVLLNLIAKNEKTGQDEKLIDIIRQAVATDGLTKAGISLLEANGFTVCKDDKMSHYKIYYGSETRYMGTFAATPSDGRNGKNFTADFGNLLFGY